MSSRTNNGHLDNTLAFAYDEIPTKRLEISCLITCISNVCYPFKINDFKKEGMLEDSRRKAMGDFFSTLSTFRIGSNRRNNIIIKKTKK